ncbi:hypothetical protein GF357_03140 [Candidatus Dojkabacteria bacterium]|nr:hypothetical protein [Candidatus Dojkabacteria bacterium]
MPDTGQNGRIKKGGIMKAEIEKRIESMRGDFLAFANYKASDNQTTLSGDEILEQSIELALQLPEDRRNEMHNTVAREKYTKLDFYILELIKASAEKNKPPVDCVKDLEEWYDFLHDSRKITTKS